MKRTIFIAMAALALSMALPGQSITVMEPASDSTWYIGIRYVIFWSQSGDVSDRVTVRLRRAGSADSDPAAEVIASETDHCTCVWIIPPSVTPGEYFVRVKTVGSPAGTPEVSGDSPNFTIAARTRDLELKRVEYRWPTFPPDGAGFGALVENHFTPIDQDVRFQFVFPDMTRDGVRVISKRLNMYGGEGKIIYLLAMDPDNIPLRGLRVQVTIDGPTSQITETNEYNNRIETRIGILDISCNARRDELTLQKISGHISEDFRVQFKIRVRHNLFKALHNVHVCWTLSGPRGEIKYYTHTIESLGAGEEHVWSVNETYGKVGRERSKQPRLREGTTYRVVASIFDPGDEFFDVSPANDTSGFSFSFPD